MNRNVTGDVHSQHLPAQSLKDPPASHGLPQAALSQSRHPLAVMPPTKELDDAQKTNGAAIVMDASLPGRQDVSEASANRPQPSRTSSNEHSSLKYSLLGPSLTKAGQDSVNQSKVAEIIYNASKGSKFFNNEESRDKNLTEKISKILARKRQLEKLDVSLDLRRADDYVAELELGRDLSQIIVHMDCDAFYAAVEELDRPELKEVPMAVGKGVLTTCNYHARKFGCRSGMAGFVAMKLCPQLICLPLNFDKYSAKAQEIRAVLAEYDARYESASVDEAYLNLTQYCEKHHMAPEEAVSQLRAEVHERTKVTVSAGIAANAKLAKIASNQNKPNGQFRIASDRQTIMDFMKTLPCRKVNGIGRVFERELDAIGIKTCGDIYAHRMYLSQLFGQKAFQFLMQCYLGLGRTNIQPAEDYERKSVGTETTFREMSSSNDLREKLRHVADELEGDLKRTGFKGRTLCIKIKLHTYEVFTRQTTPPFAIHLADDLYKYGLSMLEKLMKEIPNMKLRLMGLRVTHIVSLKKPDMDFFGRQKLSTSTTKPSVASKANSNDGWEVWPEAEFEEAARQERDEEMNELEKLSQEHERQIHEAETTNEGDDAKVQTLLDAEPGKWPCPVCTLPQAPDDVSFNSHIDFCLSRQTIKEVVQSTTTAPTPPSEKPKLQNTSSKSTPMKRKRGRAKNEPASTVDNGREKRRTFFSGGT
ncbi:DNA/RNA polymerase [Pleomassaria siparia CBS 279.74]|uniref:DNA polymerase kappa n=1 Tax=Pleomassaria siparia CBS 279.74 TaxID=1314801 RepID=A0A6G1JUE2_9PLEO|nr:DNA/RNA polymerase [Pleomassaria siparia CBS 279.74]